MTEIQTEEVTAEGNIVLKWRSEAKDAMTTSLCIPRTVARVQDMSVLLFKTGFSPSPQYLQFWKILAHSIA